MQPATRSSVAKVACGYKKVENHWVTQLVTLPCGVRFCYHLSELDSFSWHHV